MLNENLKNIRKAKGLSQEELAIKLNVVRQTVSKWELGVTTPEMDKLNLLPKRRKQITHRQPGKFTMFLTIGTMNTRADSRSSDSRWSTSMWEDGFPGRSSAAPGECLPSVDLHLGSSQSEAAQ